MNIKVLGLMGSPRSGGNTDMLLQAMLEAFASRGVKVDKVNVADLRVEPCRGCHACREGRCVIDDDMQALYTKFITYERVIVASPLYFLGLPSQLKALIDRSQFYWGKYRGRPPQPVPARKGFFVGTAGSDGTVRVFRPAISTVKAFFNTIGVSYAGEMLVTNTDTNPVSVRPEVLQEAAAWGLKLA